MPRRNNQKRKNSTKQKRSRRVRQNRAPKSSLGNLIASATTTLLSYIPGGAVFKPYADYAFKSFGWKSSSISSIENLAAETLKVVGVSSNIAIPFSRIVANSQYGAQTFQTSATGSTAALISKYEEVRLTRLTITIIPTGSLGTRQGMWCAVFLPIMDDTAEDQIAKGVYRSIPSYNDLQLINGSITRPATQKIVLHYTPSTPYTRDFHRLSSICGVLKISYLDMEREVASDIEPSEFNSQVEIDGVFMFRQSLLKNQYDTYPTRVTDLTENVSNRFDHDGRVYHTTRTGLISHSSSRYFLPNSHYVEQPTIHPILSMMTLDDELESV